MSQRSAIKFIDAAQNHNDYISFYDYNIPSESIQETKPSGLFIAESTTVQDDYLKQLILLFNLARSYSEVNYTINILVNEPSVSEPITVQPPPKRVLASMSVELSAKDLKRRLPKPDILVNEPNVPEFITVQPPPKRVLSSMSIELSAKDLKRRLPKPVISLESEVEP